jgi:diacylglycerol kinase
VKTHSLGESFRCAFQGVIFALRTERNMALHFLAAVLTLLVAALLRVTSLELACLTLTIAFVLVCELVNTALEILCDIVCCDLEPRIRRVKDVAAGAVLVSAISAVIVGILVLGPRVISGIRWILEV